MNPQIRELEEHATETATFVETALKLGGASEEEAKKTGALDRADEQIEDLFAPKYQTAGSPAHRAVWDKEFPIDIFVGQAEARLPPRPQAVMRQDDRARQAPPQKDGNALR